MLGMTRESQMDKVKAAVREAVSYADEIVRDERLRSDLRDAMQHGIVARDRIRADVRTDNVAARLANDRKLHRKLRAVLDDLDRASDRVRRRKQHRLRNGLLLLGGIGALTAASVPATRRWITGVTNGDRQKADDAALAI